eukprot:CAMPEP_0201516992 /NCGR_PEP_ID=MMETSP0161_2-20130828/8218_1 /ASSEMBLY_ACC=CAM_ASM_000251 /TAXON_ID=180227 /ORGANISM="Neoparamoeba aestuarina, Strain SoJaBio B1-5/56/2" /LENGTH=128 /DNA_ID=CAMNT_0047914363 /DNA_START=345 /DNA_END=731 /DNA_ORIENTATION=-
MKRINDDEYGRVWVKRKPNAKWSRNTLSYAKKLKEEGLMEEAGLEAYERGLKKLPFDHDRPPKDAPPPQDLLDKLEENEEAKENFEKLAPGQRRNFCLWIWRAKRQETREKRINETVERVASGLKGLA